MATTITDYALAHFYNTDGSFATGLTPTVSIYSVEDAGDIATNKNMSELSRGFYSYAFTRDLAKHYTYICDSGLSDRFRYADGHFDPSPWAHIIEGAVTAQHALAAILAAVAGDVTGAKQSTGDLNYWNQAGTVERIVQAISDKYGNRTTTLDFSDL